LLIELLNLFDCKLRHMLFFDHFMQMTIDQERLDRIHIFTRSRAVYSQGRLTVSNADKKHLIL